MRFVTFILGELGAEPLGLSVKQLGIGPDGMADLLKAVKQTFRFICPLGRLVNLWHPLP